MKKLIVLATAIHTLNVCSMELHKDSQVKRSPVYIRSRDTHETTTDHMLWSQGKTSVVSTSTRGKTLSRAKTRMNLATFAQMKETVTKPVEEYEFKQSTQRTPLHTLASLIIFSDQLSQVKNYLQSGVDPNTLDTDGRTASTLLLKNAEQFSPEYLLGFAILMETYGDETLADIMRDNNGLNSRYNMNSCEYQPFPYVDMLLTEPRYVSPNGDTTLHVAALFGCQLHETLFSGLLKIGIDPKKRNKAGDTPLDVLARCSYFYRENEDKLIIFVADLLRAGADPLEPNPVTRKTPMDNAYWSQELMDSKATRTLICLFRLKKAASPEYM